MTEELNNVELENDRIKKEENSLKRAFSGIPAEKKTAANKMIQRLAFMTITLENLEEDVKSRGATYLMENGKQRIWVENPAQKSYNTMINRYTALNDKLLGLMPKPADDGGKNDDDSKDLAKFLGERS